MATPARTVADLGDRVADLSARHLSEALRAFLVPGSLSLGDGYWSLITGEPHPLGNFAAIDSPDDLDATRKALESLAECAAPKAAIYFGEPSVPVRAALDDAGYQLAEAMPAMAVDVAQLRPTALPEGYRMVRVTADAYAREWVEAMANGYGLPLALAELFVPRPGDSPDAPCQWFGVLKGDRMVSTSGMVLRDGVAGIYCVATLPEERGKGLGAHVTAEPLRQAALMGYGVGVLQASSDGHPVYLKLGFKKHGSLPLFVNM